MVYGDVCQRLSGSQVGVLKGSEVEVFACLKTDEKINSKRLSVGDLSLLTVLVHLTNFKNIY